MRTNNPTVNLIEMARTRRGGSGIVLLLVRRSRMIRDYLQDTEYK